MKLPWFHAEVIGEANDRVEFDPNEARHAGKSARLRVGDQAVLSDGQGRTARVRIDQSEKARLLGVIESIETWPRPRPALHLASALPKGDRLSTLLSMATQVGITSFTPLHCERSVTLPPDRTPERWLRIAREAAKQSQQPWRPDILKGRTPGAYAAQAMASASLVQLDPTGEPASPWLKRAIAETPSAIAVIVGPEGGFTASETAELQNQGARSLALTTGLLRIETAAVAGLAYMALLREPVGPDQDSAS